MPPRRTSAETPVKRGPHGASTGGRDAVSLTAIAVSSLGSPGRTREGPSSDAPRAEGLPEDRSGTPEVKPTRERILDVALELFTDNGYEQTSLREIAARLGVTKAALYYHFASKEEILLALHLRLHEVASGLEDRISEPMTKDAWRSMLDAFIDRVPANRKLIAMHARNRATLEKVLPNHDQNHEDFGERLTRALNDGALPTRDRIRMGLALATVMGGLVFGGAAFEDIDSDQLTLELKSAIDDLLD